MKEEMQKKYVEFQMLQQQLKQLAQQLQQLDTQLEELNNVIKHLEEFKNLKKGSEMLVPLASGIFAYGELKETNFVRVNIGSNVSVRKSADDTITLVCQQVSELEKYKVQVYTSFVQLNQYVHALQHELVAMAEQEEKVKKE